MKKQNDTSTAVVVTTTKTVAFKIKGVAIDLTVEELESLYNEIGRALGKGGHSILDDLKDEAEKRQRSPWRERPFYSPPNYIHPPAQPWKEPPIMCLSRNSIGS